MNIKTRKIIAKELLFLFTVMILGIIGFSCTYPYNFFKEHQIGRLNDSIKRIQNISDSLNNALGNYGWQPPITDSLVSDTTWLTATTNSLPPKKIGTNADGLPIFRKRIPAEKVYDNLIKEGYTVKNLGGGKDDFIKNISNPINANKFYLHLIDEGFTEKNLGTMDEFVKAMGVRNDYWEKKFKLETKIESLRQQAIKLNSQKNNIHHQIFSFRAQLTFGFFTILFFLIFLFGFRYLFYVLKWSINTLKIK